MLHAQLISKKQASSLGMTHYFTGKECPNGHVDLRRVSSYCCISCGKEWVTRERKENPVFLEKQRKICRENNLRRYHSDDQFKDKVKKESTARRRIVYATPDGKAKYDAVSREWKRANPEKTRAMTKKWRKSNRDKVAFIESLRACIKRLKNVKSGDYKVRCLGYSRNDFFAHMESLFQPGMTWENHGEWHIDHIKPVVSFIREGNFSLHEVHSLSNLQPLWASENLSKGAKESPH